MQNHDGMFAHKSSSPCQKCEDRNVGCHATCQSYITWKDEVNRQTNEAYEKRTKDYFIWRQYVQGRRKR